MMIRFRFRRSITTSLLIAFLALPLPAQTPERGLNVVNIRAEDGKEVRLYDKSFALVVGVSDYAAGWPKLPGVKKDIEEVARALELHGFQVTKVENADSAQLDKAYKTFIDEHGLNVENRLLFYFAGHGHTIKQSYGEEMGYIVPSDAPNPKRDRAGFMSKAMDMQQIELYARRIQAKHALFLFDSCFSGAIFALSRAVPDSISYKTARPVRQFITSGSADEEVPDQSVFRHQFVEAISGEADSNPKDGYVTGSELGEFLQDKVVNYSRNAQHPQYGKIRNPNLDKGDFVFALPKKATSPAVAVKPNASEPASPTPMRVDPAALELALWDAIKNSIDPEDFKEYLDKHPNGQFAGIARRRMNSIHTDSKSAKDSASVPETRPTTSKPEELFTVRVRVRSDNTANGWTDSGLMVRRGQHLRVSATGRVSLGLNRFSTPIGLSRVADDQKLMRNAPTGGLIAVVGDDNDAFIYVGSDREFYAPRDGRLFLGVNEGNLNDNTGTYDALVEAQPVQELPSESSNMVGQTDSSQEPSNFFPVRIRVRSDNTANGWTDSGLMVRRGQRLRVSATGRVSLGLGRFSTPTGLPRILDAEKLMRGEPTGGLIAVVGDDNDEFIFIGANREFSAPHDGRLFLGVNEGNLADNVGYFDVLIEIEPERN